MPKQETFYLRLHGRCAVFTVIHSATAMAGVVRTSRSFEPLDNMEHHQAGRHISTNADSCMSVKEGVDGIIQFHTVLCPRKDRRGRPRGLWLR